VTLEVDVDVRVLGSSPEAKGTTSFRGDELKAIFIGIQRKRKKRGKNYNGGSKCSAAERNQLNSSCSIL
jgi:hypothetical protein